MVAMYAPYVVHGVKVGGANAVFLVPSGKARKNKDTVRRPSTQTLAAKPSPKQASNKKKAGVKQRLGKLEHTARKMHTCPLKPRDYAYAPKFHIKCIFPHRQIAYLSFAGAGPKTSSSKMVKCKLRNCVGKVDAATQRTTQLLLPGVSQKITQLRKKMKHVKKLVLVGHDYGAAIAELTTMALINSTVTKGLKLGLVVAGAPAIASDKMVKKFHKLTHGHTTSLVTEFPAADCACKPKWMADPVRRLGRSFSLIPRVHKIPCPAYSMKRWTFEKFAKLSRCSSLNIGSLWKRFACHRIAAYSFGICQFVSGTAMTRSCKALGRFWRLNYKCYKAGKCHLGSKVDTKGCLACLKNKFGSELRFFA